MIIDLEFYNLAKEVFTLNFCKRVVDEPQLALLFSIEPCLRCVNPYLRLINMTSVDKVFYRDKPDCYYILRVLVSHINSGVVKIEPGIMETMTKTLGFYISNPLLYLFLGFSLCSMNGDFIRSERCSIEQLKVLKNSEIYNFMLNTLFELNGVNFTGEDTVKVLLIYIQFVTSHFKYIGDWLESENRSEASKAEFDIDFGGDFLAEPSRKR